MTLLPPQPPGSYPLPAEQPPQTNGTIAALTAGAMCVGAIVGICVGIPAGIVFYELMATDNASGWDNFGAAILAFLGGGAVGAVAYMLAAISAVRRWIEEGQRMWPIIIVSTVPAIPTMMIFTGI